MDQISSPEPAAPPALQPWLLLGELIFKAAEVAADRAAKAFKSSRNKTGCSRHPGHASPLWNICATQLKNELAAYGSKARLARYLGIPRQRLQDFLHDRSRLPDAEIALRLLHWLSEKRNGRDLSL
jgi:hypothetical protein